MAGRLFAVVGPSGAGKDTVINATLKECAHIKRVKRVITRPNSAGGEDIQSVSQQDFDRMKADGRFALTWCAHGLSYGIPREIDDRLAAGQSLVFNGSRKALDEIIAQYPDICVISIEAKPEVLAKRLAERARETSEDITARLKRAERAMPNGTHVIRISNDGPLETAVSALIDVFNSQEETV